MPMAKADRGRFEMASKIEVTAVVTFKVELDPNSDLVPVDQAHDAAVGFLPSDVTLEEILSWEPA